MNDSEVQAGKARIKTLKWTVYLSIVLICSVFFLIGILAPAQTAIRFADWINMPILFGFIRYSLYALLALKWKSIARSFNPKVSEELIKKTHRQVMTLCAVYEVFFVWNILSHL